MVWGGRLVVATPTQCIFLVDPSLVLSPTEKEKTMHRLLLLSSWIGLILSFWPISAQAITLLDAYHRAVDYDAGLQMSRSQKAAALEILPQSRAALTPALSFAAQRSRMFQHTQDKDTYDTSGYSLNLQAPLFHWDRIVALDMAKKKILQAEVDYSLAEQDMLMRVAKSYFGVLSAQENWQLAQTEEKAFSRQLQLTEENFKVGAAIVTDLEEARAGYDGALAQVIAAQNAVDESQESLAQVIGYEKDNEPYTVVPLQVNIPLQPPNPEKVSAWVNSAQRNNLDLNRARLEVALAGDGLRHARSGDWPMVDLQASRVYADSNAAPTPWLGGTTETDSITVQLNLPLFQGGEVRSQVRQAAHTQSAAERGLEQSERKILANVRNSFRRVQTDIAQVRAFEKALTSSESNLNTTRESQAAGLRTMVDALNAARDFFRAKRALADARYRYILDTLALKQAVGSVSEEDLIPINQWLGNTP